MQQEIVHSKLQIAGIRKINHDTYIYDLKWAGDKIKLTIGQHIRFVENIKTHDAPEGEEVVRKYTPISPCSQEVFVFLFQDLLEILIKIYRANVHPKFPHGGKMTTYIESLKEGDTINVEGPFGRFGYKAGGVVVIDGEELKKKRIFFVAGGSGITPCYQTIIEILKMPNEDIELILLFANKTEEDIVLRKELEALQPRLKLHYIVDTAPQGWTGFTGFATKDVLEKICPLDDPDTMYIHCGPGPMNAMIREMFTTHYPESHIFKY